MSEPVTEKRPTYPPRAPASRRLEAVRPTLVIASPWRGIHSSRLSTWRRYIRTSEPGWIRQVEIVEIVTATASTLTAPADNFVDNFS